MKKLHFSIHINAPKEKVWDTMLGQETYKIWTEAFNPGSYYKGNWEEGSKMLFLGPNPAGGGEGGMVSKVKENRKYEFLSVEHQGIVNEGVEDTESEEAKKWAPAFENYTFQEKDGGTEVSVDMEGGDAYEGMFDETWPKALLKLKELVEA